MSCTHWEEQIYLYTDGLLSEDDCHVLLTHLYQCESCSQLLFEVQSLNELLTAEAALISPPEGFSNRIMASLPKNPWQTREEIPAQGGQQTVVPLERKQGNGKRLSRWSTAVAAAVLVAAVGVGHLPKQVTPGNVGEPQKGLPVANRTAPVEGDLPSAEQPITTAEADAPVAPVEDAIVAPIAPAPREAVKAVIGSGEVTLPKVAAGKEKTGIYSLLLLAACEDGDALNPVVLDDGTVEYFVRSDYGISKWQSNGPQGGEPVLLENNVKLGATQGVNTITKAEWLTDSAYTEALSPLGDMTLLNSMTKDGGLWKIVASRDRTPKLLHPASGGNLLSWSPDGTKAIYTDKAGNLYVVYPTEEVVMSVFEGNVASVSWSKDSRMIAFSAVAPGDNGSAVYSAVLP